MEQAKEGAQPWREPQIVFENEHWTVTDYRPEETFQIVSARGFGFTVLYEEWEGFVEAVRLLQTQGEVDTEFVAAAQVEGEEDEQWYFNILYPEHMLSFFVDKAEWQALQEAIEEASAYPWSEIIYRVDDERMRAVVGEQAAWLRKRGESDSASP